jgi:hypothetical protein
MFDNTKALSEGWDLFDVEGRLHLQRVDLPDTVPELGYLEPKFESDAEAIIFVSKAADAGSQYHMDALHLIGALAENITL